MTTTDAWKRIQEANAARLAAEIARLDAQPSTLTRPATPAPVVDTAADRNVRADTLDECAAALREKARTWGPSSTPMQELAAEFAAHAFQERVLAARLAAGGQA